MIITKKLIKYNFTPDANKPFYIVVHDTGNPDAGANALMHYNYFNNGNRQASAHFFVDDTRILQLIEVKDSAWHVGDGRNVHGINNNNSIGVEICLNRNGDYEKAVSDAADLVAYLMQQYKIPIEKVVRHYAASRKNCPQSMNNNGDWSAWETFKNTVAERSKNGMDNINLDSKPTVHWAQSAFDELKAKGITINETRFDDNITRAEVFVLLNQILKLQNKT